VSVFGTVADCHTRPQIVIDSSNRVLHMLATAPSSGGCPYTGSPGTIYAKTAPLNDLTFPPGRGTPVIRDAASANLNNVTATKQNVTAATGLVVLASNDATRRYWHADLALTAPRPNVGFTAAPLSGTAPLPVSFTDTSTGGVTSWAWTFGDGGTSTLQNPAHTYTTAGTYTVTLTGTNANGGSASSTATVQVSAPPEANAVGFGGATSTGQSTAGTSVTLTKPAGTAVGDLLVASMTADNAPNATAPAGWTSFLPTLRPGGASVFGYYHVVTAADANTTSWVWTLSKAQKWSGGVSRYVNVDGSRPLDSAATTAVTANLVSSITVPAVTTATAGAAVVGGVGADAASVSATSPPGWTEAWQNRVGKLAESAYVSAAGVGSQGSTTWSLGGARAMAAWTVALRPASAGG
jgi:PKD repeat protein